MADAGQDIEKGIPTNLRLLLLLEEVARAGEPLTPTAANEVLGLPKPSVHRLFQRLEDEGFLQRDIDGRSYAPGARMRKLAVNVMSSSRLRTVRLTILNAVAAEVGETCNIAVPDREAMYYLDRVETTWPLRIQLPIGTNVPFHCTASGKMYLSSLAPRLLDRLLTAAPLEEQTPATLTDPKELAAEIALIRERGYATDAEEFMEGMVAIAVPIHDDFGRLMSTLSVHAPTQRMSIPALEGHLKLLYQASEDFSALVLS